MATFIMLSRLSPEGMKTLRDNPQRLQEVNREVEEFGARVVQQYALLGHHDFLTVLEAPDAETVSRVSVELSSRATASYETLPAIEVEEFVGRLRGEREGPREAPQPTAEPVSSTRRSQGSMTEPHEGVTSEPPPRAEPSGGAQLGREQTREEIKEEIREEMRREEASRTRPGEGSPRSTEGASARGRESSEPPEREHEEDRGLVDRAMDAVLGSEEDEPSRRREGTDRPDRR